MRSARLVKLAMVAVVLAVGAGALALARSNGASSQDFHGAPVPALFGPADLRVVDGPLRAAEARGHRVARAWLDAHPVTTDAAFAAWAVNAVGPPPGGATPKLELARLRALAAQRTAAGTVAATWLESHGKKQPWKAIRNQTETFHPRSDEQRYKAALKTAFALGARIETAAKDRYHRPPPYATDPALSRGGVRVDKGGQASYPSSHMVDAGIGIALLDQLAPEARGEYQWMADQVAFSRLYTAGHYLSDVTAGAFLGTLIGDYELRASGLSS